MEGGDRTNMNIVFIHGLWLNGEYWNPWIAHFKQNGHEARALSWPGDGPTTAATRANPTALAGFGVAEIADHIAGQLRSLPQKPVLSGPSFGGLLVQNPLGPCHAAAAGP